MRLPTIHINGTSVKDLLEGYDNAHYAITNAMDKISLIEFNPRDYYTQGPDAWTTAREEMNDRLRRLKSVADELEQIMEHIFRHQKQPIP